MIRDVIRSGAEAGFLTAEGPCGTGKTLAALMGPLALVRDEKTQYERVLCLTSVKQQLRAFEADLKAINQARPEETPIVTGLSLVGKSSACSYTEAGTIDANDIYHQCETLREPVKRIAERGADAVGELEQLVSAASAGGNLADTRDDGSAPTLTSAGPSTNVASGQSVEWEAPYSPGIPENENETAYCPFYAQSRAIAFEEGENDRSPGALVFADAATPGVLTPADIRRLGSQRGLCPHLSMMQTAEHADFYSQTTTTHSSHGPSGRSRDSLLALRHWSSATRHTISSTGFVSCFRTQLRRQHSPR
jgi:DNA excision repair protein ERCC-2